MTRRTTPQVVVLLLVLGAACVTVRTNLRQKAPLPTGVSVWRLKYSAGFHARKSGARLRAAFPENTRHSRVAQNVIAESELVIERHRPSQAGLKKDLVAKAVKPGQYEFHAQFDIQLSRRGGWRPDATGAPVTAEDRAKFLGDEKSIQIGHPVVAETLERLRAGQASKDELVERLFEHCLADIVPGGPNAPHDAAAALAKGTASVAGRARAFVALCRAGKIPARLVTGFEMKMAAEVRPHTWVEVLTNGRWESYDPENGFARDIPYYFVPVRRDNVDVIRVTESSGLVTKYSVTRLPNPPGLADSARHNPLAIFDLRQLPAKLHEPMALILLLPLGALVTAFFRTVIGIRTFGTFTPTLLALAFVYNDWRTGLVVFATVLVLGFTSRSLLDRLKLLLVPRLGIILTLVVLLMVFSVSVMHHYQWTPPGDTVLLPMVILTMLVERFFITSEEDSPRFAVQLLIATVVLGFIVYLVLRWQKVGSMLFDFPELHCFTVASLILVGRYTGYRWTELLRFRDFVERKGPPSDGPKRAEDS